MVIRIFIRLQLEKESKFNGNKVLLMNNRERLIDLISEHKLERLDIAEMVKVDLEQVGRWLASSEAKQHEEVPDMAIELLELKLKLNKTS